jgi:hypothetical protein
LQNPNGIFSVGSPGGVQLASQLEFMRKNLFKGFIGLVGASMPTTYNFESWNIILGWSPPGRLDNTSTTDDNRTDHGWSDWGFPSSVFPENYRFALITDETDFRRTEITGIYRDIFMNLGNRAKLIGRPGGRAVHVGSSLEDAVR